MKVSQLRRELIGVAPTSGPMRHHYAGPHFVKDTAERTDCLLTAQTSSSAFKYEAAADCTTCSLLPVPLMPHKIGNQTTLTYM
jgi:hypothetical protein